MYILKDILIWLWQNGQIIGLFVGLTIAFVIAIKRLINHEKRLIKIETHLNWIIKICDRRKFNMPVLIERRKSGNF